MKRWQQIQQYFDIKAGAVIGLFTVQMFAMCWCVFFKVGGQLEIPESIRWVYGMVMGGVTFSGVTKIIKGS